MPTNKKDYMKEYMTQYVQKKKNKIICEICGSEIMEYQKYKHQKTKKHLNAQNNKPDDVKLTKKEYDLLMEKLEAIERKYDSTQNGYDGFLEND